jgi:hypothetical protein
MWRETKCPRLVAAWKNLRPESRRRYTRLLKFLSLSNQVA